MNEYEPNKTILQSYAYHEDGCFFVSTIERNYSTCAGYSRGYETIVWEWNPETQKRGDIVHQASGIRDHIEICQAIIVTGKLPLEDE